VLPSMVTATRFSVVFAEMEAETEAELGVGDIVVGDKFKASEKPAGVDKGNPEDFRTPPAPATHSVHARRPLSRDRAPHTGGRSKAEKERIK
jgi:hypothetical protein